MIPPLPPTYVDHLVAPRGASDLPEAEAAGQRGSMVGGMGVRVTLAWRGGPNGEARIKDVGVRCFGSAAPIAPGSWLVEHLRGCTWEKSQEVTPAHLIEGLLGGYPDRLPRAVHKGAGFVIGALHCALGLPLCRPSDPQGPGILVCRCLDVGDRQIRREVAKGATTPEAVGDGCGASTGCRSCRPDVLLLIHEERAPRPPAPSPSWDPVVRVAHARIGPLLAAYGLPLRDAEVTNTGIRLRLGPPETDAAVTPRGALGIARYVLRETVAEDIEVTVAGVDEQTV